MSTPLNILILEDDFYDAQLAIAVLEEAGYECRWKRVETQDEYLACLDTSDYNLILADYNLPTFDGLTALGQLLERNPDIPFILVSGELGEEKAIESLKAGATDYVLKHHISRLGPVVKRALHEKKELRRRRRAEEQLHKLSWAIEQSPVSVLITDPLGHIEYVNPKFTQISGYTATEVRGKIPNILKSDKTPHKEYERLWNTITAGGEWRGEFHNRKKNGELYWELASVSPIKNNKGEITHFLAVKEDITERKQLEAQLIQSQKMEAVGQLAGGVAHDFNNLLTVIEGYAELLLDQRNDPNDSIYQDIQQIKKAGERAATLTRQLLAFSRKQALQLQRLNLNEVIAGVEKMLGRLISEDIHLITIFDPTPAYIKADQGQLEQVLVNLVINARDAMPQGGWLIIETADMNITGDDTEQHFEITPGLYVMLSVTDTGRGIDAATQTRIFEPFFTTKALGKGTGLGLSTVYGIVQQSGGFISVFSELGQGTTFKIYLPQLETTTEVDDADQKHTGTLSGSETILLVEDDAGVRLVAQKFLEHNGYTVLEASNSKEALYHGNQYRDQINLLLTDVVLPDISGGQLAKQLVKTRPNLRVLYMSGYMDEVIDQYNVTGPDIALLHKPFTSNTLLRAVRQMLDASTL